MIQNHGSRLAFALLFILFGVYVVTASGHTYSPDEESIFYVSQSFLTRGEFEIPDPAHFPVVSGLVGLNGKRYSGTGLLPSLSALPFLALGNVVANSLDARWHDFAVRLILLNVFNALVGAAGAVLLYAWWRRLGVTPRAAFALALVYGLATLTWVYARTLFSETWLAFLTLLACYAVSSYGSTRARSWLFVAGLAAGLAALTKVQGLLIVPAVIVYAVLTLWRQTGQSRVFVRTSVVPALVFGIGIVIGLGIFGYYNAIRFGTPFELGYGSVSTNYPILEGLYGLLLSPGKSVFLYAPPILLGVIALPRFARRFAPEAITCGLIILAMLVFHARVSYWHGDGAWGPRYLAMTMAFWLLPLATSIQTWWAHRGSRALVLILVVAGIAVNLLGIGINFDTYLQIQPNSGVRYFKVEGTPILAQWDLIHARSIAWLERFIPTTSNAFMFTGWLNPGAEDEPFPRFLTSTATILIQNLSQAPAQLSLVALDYRPENQPKRTLDFLVNGVLVPAERVPHADASELEYRVNLPAARTTLVTLATQGSKLHGRSPQGDELGLHVQSLEVQADGTALPLYIEPWVPPLSTADPKQRAAWFYEPAFAQFDWFGWYVAFSGLPANVVYGLIGVFVALGGTSLAAGIVLARRSWSS